MSGYSQFFYLVNAGQGRWAIRHRITDEPAGAVERSGPAFEVYDDRDRLVATSDSIEHALAELYATASDKGRSPRVKALDRVGAYGREVRTVGR